MSTNAQQAERKVPAQPKPQGNGNIRYGSRDQEIENLKRLLANVSQRLDGLKGK